MATQSWMNMTGLAMAMAVVCSGCSEEREPELTGEVFAPLDGAGLLATDESSVYITGPDAVVKISIANGTRTILARLGGTSGAARDGSLRGGTTMVLDDTHVYFASQLTGSLGRIEKSGGVPEPVLTTKTHQNFFPTAVAVLGDTIFVGAGYREPNGELWALDKSGRGGVQIGAMRSIPSSLVSDRNGIYWVDRSGAVRKLATSGNGRGSDSQAGDVKDLLADPNQNARGPLVQDDTSLYVFVAPPEKTEGRIIAIDKSSGATREVSIASTVRHLFADTSEPDGVTRLYWSTSWSYGDQILRMRVGGPQETESIARTKHVVDEFTVSRDSVFWLDFEDRALRRIPKH